MSLAEAWRLGVREITEIQADMGHPEGAVTFCVSQSGNLGAQKAGLTVSASPLSPPPQVAGLRPPAAP